jgi:transcriptional regulator with XRE-family HTH domain
LALVAIRNQGSEKYIMADHSEFARRLLKACENNVTVPEKGKGQQVWLAQKMNISQEAVRKYMEGLARPRPDKMTKLAKLLNVDESWLALGVNPEMDQKGIRQYKNRVEAAGYLTFGVFMSNNYSCAFGEEGDERVDFYAIKGGQQKAVAVTTARERSKGVWFVPGEAELRADGQHCRGADQTDAVRVHLSRPLWHR